MAARGPKIPGARLSEKILLFFFEFLRTSDTSMGSVAISNHAYEFYRNFNSQRGVCKVN